MLPNYTLMMETTDKRWKHGGHRAREVRKERMHRTRASPIPQAGHPGIQNPNTVFSRECRRVYRPAGPALQPESTYQCFQPGGPPTTRTMIAFLCCNNAVGFVRNLLCVFHGVHSVLFPSEEILSCFFNSFKNNGSSPLVKVEMFWWKKKELLQ